MLETTWIDTHTHLFASEFDSDRSGVIARAVEAGVKVLLLPNIDCESIGSLEALLDQYPDYCLGAMGLHPTSVEADWRVQMRQIEQALGRRKYAAIGEIGLDFYWDLSHADEQREAFCYQLALCKEMGLPALIHARNATAQVLEILRRREFEGLRCVLHAFTGGVEEVVAAMELEGVYLGLGGICTFKRGIPAEAYQAMRIDRIVLETDSPYLAPVPHRGRRNESAYIPLIGEFVASQFGLTPMSLAGVTTQNALRMLFGG